ncbi:MAG TPA: cytochrome c4 [Gammaproteobacteria bacterium]|nr:cytochrome c4 [Gammaproteobacteria bacterium]
MKKLAITVLIAAGLVGGAHGAGNAESGKGKAAACGACHGADGNSLVPNFPKLAGQHPAYLVKQLADFKSGARTDATMAPMAAPLSEQDMEDLAAYFASQNTSAGKGNPELATLGEKIYRGGNPDSGVAACAACHGPAGAGNPAAKFPRIAGQQVAYVVKALNDFKSGARSNDTNKMMRMVAGRMTADEIKAVAEFVAGLH